MKKDIRGERGKTAEHVGTLLKSQLRPLEQTCQWLIISFTWMHCNVNRSNVKITARAKIRAFLHLLWTKWNGGKKRRRAESHDSYVRDIMYFCCFFTFGLPTYFASNLFLLRAICALFTGGVSRKTVLLANVLLGLLFDFDNSVDCYMFCSCSLFGSFLFARYVISSYNVLSGRTMFNINRKDCLFLVLR